MSVERQCAECGCDRWQHRAYERGIARRDELQRSVEGLARDNGLLRWQLKDALATNAEANAGLRRKIIRQSRVIVRLEKRLRDRGAKPYEGAPLGESAPGVEYDAEEPLPPRVSVEEEQ